MPQAKYLILQPMPKLREISVQIYKTSTPDFSQVPLQIHEGRYPNTDRLLVLIYYFLLRLGPHLRAKTSTYT